MRAKRWILIVGAALCIAVVYAVLSLRNDDSTLSVLTRYVKERMCWSADSSTVCALRTMSRYEKKGRYDDAIRIGIAWAEKHPDNFSSGWIYEDISALYLRRATMDNEHRDEYVKQALLYRDKAVLLLFDSPYALQVLVTISESAGDLSTAQRCVQYENSIRLLNRMNLLANKERDRLRRQFKPDMADRKQMESLSEWIDVGIKRVNGKSASFGCQEKLRSPG